MTKKKQNRREFLKVGAAGLATLALFGSAKGELPGMMAYDPYPELVEITIPQLQAKLKSGQLTSRRLVEMYIERIKMIDTKTRSVLELNPDALAIADQMDKERKKGRVRSMLHGIPILIKDNIDTADKMKTTAGSLALVDAPTPKEDAFVAQRLRKAGAIILGKTNLSEWANFRGNRSISGWSGRGLQTNNPYFLDQNPCGSSSGSGVSVSANLAAAAVGTETNGSIICPAVSNGVVGLKPTLGLISRSGIIPIAHTQDTAGPMTRTVTDAAIMLGAMVGRDKHDPETANADERAAKDYTKFLDADGLKGARLGLVMQYTTRPEVKAFNEPFIESLRAAGATLIDVTFTPDYSKISTERTDVLLYEFKADLNKYLASRGSKYKTLEDLIKFNDENKELELKLFGQELFLDAQKKGDLNDKAYLDALAKIKKATREDGIDAVMAKDKLDALVAPTSGATWSIAAVAGYPYITVPVGLRENTVAGFAFFGRAFSEPTLLKYAYAFEQRTKGRVVPQFLPTYPKTK
ncbi:MAG: amidase [Pyrinomonadaceae bacterium]|nr:amidase [Pyrinomonadaceae bacterium]MBP6211637.1 amidase [Pyrinomonadaceae bacterium]